MFLLEGVSQSLLLCLGMTAIELMVNSGRSMAGTLAQLGQGKLWCLGKHEQYLESPVLI